MSCTVNARCLEWNGHKIAGFYWYKGAIEIFYSFHKKLACQPALWASREENGERAGNRGIVSRVSTHFTRDCICQKQNQQDAAYSVYWVACVRETKMNFFDTAEKCFGSARI